MAERIGKESRRSLRAGTKEKKRKEFYATEIMIRILGFIKSAILVTSRWQKRRKDLKGSILICIYDLKERNHG